ncbi:MAG: hypothetical protein ACJ71Z_13215 [Aeromicrobium sp.]
MDLMLMRLHQKQIAHQCRASQVALDIAQQGLSSNDQHVFWAGVESFLNAAANISKSLWGAGGRLEHERQPLRESLNVTDDSPLASTDLRNHLEHFDERLDRWYATSSSHGYADFIIGPKQFTISGMDEADMFRQFDPSTGEIIFWGEFHPLFPIRDAIGVLAQVAATEASKPHW